MGIFIFLLGMVAVFVVLPYWGTRALCGLLQIGTGNRHLRFILWGLIAWATWDWFQTNPAMWEPGRLASRQNQDVLLTLLCLFAATQAWMRLKDWRKKIAREIREEAEHDAALTRAFYGEDADPEMARAFLRIPLLRDGAHFGAPPPPGSAGSPGAAR
jgi:hypothetical protein